MAGKYIIMLTHAIKISDETLRLWLIETGDIKKSASIKDTGYGESVKRITARWRRWTEAITHGLKKEALIWFLWDA